MAPHVCCIVADATARFAPDMRIETGSGLRAAGGLGSKNFLYRRILQGRRKRGIRVRSRQLFVAIVFGLSQLNQATLQVPGFRDRLGKQEIESSPVSHRAVLQNRPAPRAVVLEELWIQRQRLTERGDGLLVFFVAKVGIAKVAVENGHVTTNRDRFLIRLDGPAVLLPLIPNWPDVVLRIGIGRVKP